MQKSDFKYQLPPELIAQQPLTKRTDSRLLSINKHTGAYQDHVFQDFINFLQPQDLLVFNDTQVIPARLFGKKSTGGKVEILIERILNTKQALAHIKASKAPKAKTIIELTPDYQCQILGRENDLFKLEFNSHESILEILNAIGHIPLPPYITRADNETDFDRYQTVFAKQQGAVAAPTAGLHFDAELMQKIQQKNIATSFVTLHVGSGTFQPVRVENLDEHLMHTEYFAVSDAVVQQVQATQANGGRIIAIGTTALRALESASKTGRLKPSMGNTDLFIRPNGYQFKTVDALLTNFHLPESTLLMLISAFAGYENIRAAYQHAIQAKYRFFSYGDAMFLSNKESLE